VTGQTDDIRSQVPRLKIQACTHPGQVRPLNEDAWQIASEEETGHLWEQRGRLLAVADGMGGHAAGEVASKLALETLHQEYYGEDDTPLPPAIRLERAVLAANLAIYEQAVNVDAQLGMGTTIVAAVLYEDRALLANVGDSRAYLVREGESRQITDDHSWVAEQVKVGTLTEEEAQNHVYRNLVTRCLGHRPGIQVDMFEHRMRAGDTLLLCSDGLSNMVTQDEITAVLASQEPKEATQTLIDTANERGGPDNITAVIARVLEITDRLAENGRSGERPERLSAKTTQPVRLERTTIERVVAARSSSTPPRAASPAPRPRISPRRRATLVLAAIALVAVLATALLIALRMEKINRWLAWPAPAPLPPTMVPGTGAMLGSQGRKTGFLGQRLVARNPVPGLAPIAALAHLA
jgi:serine/threonine protein phosphatase PrpC